MFSRSQGRVRAPRCFFLIFQSDTSNGTPETNLHTLTFRSLPSISKCFWSFIALLLHSSLCARIDSDASGVRQPRQQSYRGNTRFQVPTYLNPDAYSRTVYSTDHRGSDGNFGYEYQTDNGISVKQDSTGYGPDKVVRGYYSYVGSDGITYTTNYIADRFGYRAYGAHLPAQPDSIYDQTKFPVYNRPANNPYYVTSTPPPPQVYPLNHQHQTQSVYYPQSTLGSQPIYVPERAPSSFINITPKPLGTRLPPSTPLPPSSILPPYNYGSHPGNYGSHPGQYSNPPYSWTTARPDYNNGFSTATSRPFVQY
jgi:Insect cuticle protein